MSEIFREKPYPVLDVTFKGDTGEPYELQVNFALQRLLALTEKIAENMENKESKNPRLRLATMDEALRQKSLTPDEGKALHKKYEDEIIRRRKA